MEDLPLKRARTDAGDDLDTGVVPVVADAEDFSDFGGSDDEILIKESSSALLAEATDSSAAVPEDGEASNSRSSSRKSLIRDGGVDDADKRDNDLLEGISDEDLDVSDDEDAKKTKAKLADALGVGYLILRRHLFGHLLIFLRLIGAF